jgi:hypothetical protein
MITQIINLVPVVNAASDVTTSTTVVTKSNSTIVINKTFMDTFMFNPSNIKSLYWRTMAIIARHFLVYFIFLNIILLGWVYFTFKVESLRNFFYMQKKKNELKSPQRLIPCLFIFSLIGFLTIKFLVDRFINWFDITYSIIFIIIAFIQCFCFWSFLVIEKKDQKDILKTLRLINIIILLNFSILNFSLSFLNGYKKLWGVNEDVINISEDVINISKDIINISEDVINISKDVINISKDVINISKDVIHF